MAAARMQCQALLLSTHDYLIEYRKAHLHANADWLSRLPLPEVHHETTGSVEVFFAAQLDTLPVSNSEITRNTESDPIEFWNYIIGLQRPLEVLWVHPSMSLAWHQYVWKEACSECSYKVPMGSMTLLPLYATSFPFPSHLLSGDQWDCCSCIQLHLHFLSIY